MSAAKSWQFLGGPGSLPYQVFDRVRNRVNRRLVDYLVESCSLSPGARVVEAGSGPGFGASLLGRRRDVFSIALDIDLDALRVARARDPQLPLVTGDLRRLPFKSSTFDLVWSSSTIEHLDNPREVVAEMARVAAGNRHVFVGVPAKRGPLGWQRYVAESAVGVWIGRVFDRQELERLLIDAGLVPVRFNVYFFRFFVAALAVKR